jgi:putative AdoMet-dependent methyltransferase
VTSRNVDRFNHDLDAPLYDADVMDETQPIRAGYSALLEWVAREADVHGCTVLDLGAGTGNLTVQLSRAKAIVAVDTSARMLSILRDKCRHLDVSCELADLLGYFDTPRRCDRVVSTYAVHHLESDEKDELFRKIRDSLAPRGRAVFGDLMFASGRERNEIRSAFATRGLNDVVEAIDDEYFWLLDDVVPALERLGFTVETRRFSELSWGVCCRLD